MAASTAVPKPRPGPTSLSPDYANSRSLKIGPLTSPPPHRSAPAGPWREPLPLAVSFPLLAWYLKIRRPAPLALVPRSKAPLCPGPYLLPTQAASSHRVELA